MSAMEIVQFHGSALEAVRVDETVWVSVRRMCEALGLDESGQRQKLGDRARTPWATTGMTPSVAEDGKIREVFCLDLDSVPMWLATIDASRVAEASRPKVILFQRECAKALRDHFTKRALPTRTEVARMLLAESERADRLEAENLLLAPKADFYDRVAESKGFALIGDVAKTLGFGRNRFFAMLRGAGIIGLHTTVANQTHIDAGRFKVFVGVHERTEGPEAHFTTKVTGKGFVWLAKMFGRPGVEYRFPEANESSEAAQ